MQEWLNPGVTFTPLPRRDLDCRGTHGPDLNLAAAGQVAAVIGQAALCWASSKCVVDTCTPATEGYPQRHLIAPDTMAGPESYAHQEYCGLKEMALHLDLGHRP